MAEPLDFVLAFQGTVNLKSLQLAAVQDPFVLFLNRTYHLVLSFTTHTSSNAQKSPVFSLSYNLRSLLDQSHILLHQACYYKIGRCVRSRASQWQSPSVWKNDKISISSSSCNVHICPTRRSKLTKEPSASLAGISLPTDPAVLLRLGPLASRLAAALPTSSVLAVLETAAPQSFISRVVHDASYAQSFESAFAAGSSPSWFTALPTDVKSYLHTYSGFGGLATVAGAVESAEATVSSGNTASPSTPSSTAASTSSASGTSAPKGSTSTKTTTQTSTTGSSASSGKATGENSASSTSAATPGGAVQLSGTFAASFAGMVGVIAFALLL